MGGCPASAYAITTTTTPHGNITTDSLPSSPCNDLYTWDHVPSYAEGAEVKYGLSSTHGQLVSDSRSWETRWIPVDCHAFYAQRRARRI